jgi:hypothetical protein
VKDVRKPSKKRAGGWEGGHNPLKESSFLKGKSVIRENFKYAKPLTALPGNQENTGAAFQIGCLEITRQSELCQEETPITGRSPVLRLSHPIPASPLPSKIPGHPPGKRLAR